MRQDTVWDAPLPDFPPLREDKAADVCVVGGGLAGLTTAYLLAREGLSVVLLEAGPLGAGETGRSLAQLSNALEARYYDLEARHGAPGARLAADSHTFALDRVEQIVREYHLDCDFQRVDGYLLFPPGDPTEALQRELTAAHRAGLNSVLMMTGAPLEYPTGHCLCFPDQAQFHPARFLAGLAKVAAWLGVEIFPRSAAASLSLGPTVTVRTDAGHQVTAGNLVLATSSRSVAGFTFPMDLAPMRTYTVALRLEQRLDPALFWDGAHSVRMFGDLLLVSGEAHRTGRAHPSPEFFKRLEKWACARFPAGDAVARWSSQVLSSGDGLAYLGRLPELGYNGFVVLGSSLADGVIGAQLVADLIMRRPNPWTMLYYPPRVLPPDGRKIVREALACYAGWLTAGEYSSPHDIPAGEGGLIREGLRKHAYYREPSGELHKLNAVCPHAGGIVTWNGVEKTWDCPCHGSRFDAFGRVLCGPARCDLVRQPLEHVVEA